MNGKGGIKSLYMLNVFVFFIPTHSYSKLFLVCDYITKIPVRRRFLPVAEVSSDLPWRLLTFALHAPCVECVECVEYVERVECVVQEAQQYHILITVARRSIQDAVGGGAATVSVTHAAAVTLLHCKHCCKWLWQPCQNLHLTNRSKGQTLVHDRRWCREP